MELYDNDVISVKLLLDASQKLIKVNTDPPVYLGSKILYTSKTLMQLSSIYCLSNNKATNQGHTVLLELNNTDDIPVESWEALDNLIEKCILPVVFTDSTIVDDILYLLNKYEIQVSPLSLDKPIKLNTSLCNIIYSGGIFPRLDSDKANPAYYEHVVNAYTILLRNKEKNVFENLYENHVNLIRDVFRECIDPFEDQEKSKKMHRYMPTKHSSGNEGTGDYKIYIPTTDVSINARIQRDHQRKICYRLGIHADCEKDGDDSDGDTVKAKKSEKNKGKVKSKKGKKDETDSDGDTVKKKKSKKNKGKVKIKKLQEDSTDSDSDTDGCKQKKSEKSKKDTINSFENIDAERLRDHKHRKCTWKGIHEECNQQT